MIPAFSSVGKIISHGGSESPWGRKKQRFLRFAEILRVGMLHIFDEVLIDLRPKVAQVLRKVAETLGIFVFD